MKKKKIAIVTWIGNGNYGTALQAFALFSYLSRKGYKDLYVISSIPNMKGFLFNKILNILRGIGIRREWQNLKYKKTMKFISKYIRTPHIMTESQRNRFIDSVDVFVTGSDQIWNTYYKYNPFMFLDFVDGKRKVAYASSLGTNSVNEKYKDEVKRLLLQFDNIGVREYEAVKVVSDLTGRKDIVQVLDPTFLLHAQDWIDVFSQSNIEVHVPEKYILCYLIGGNEQYKEQLERVKKLTGLSEVIIISSEENPNFSIEKAIVYDYADPLEFVKLIYNSEFVCTDSFHATALCINLHKQFVEFMRFKDSEKISQNSRIYDVLMHYNLMDRIFDINSTIWSEPIDFTDVEKILTADRNFSESYIINAIENSGSYK